MQMLNPPTLLKSWFKKKERENLFFTKTENWHIEPKNRRRKGSRSVKLLWAKTELRHPSVISPVSTTSSMLFSLSFSSVRGLLVCWLWPWPPEGPRWVDPASGGLDHTFHRSQLSDGELHLLSEAGWARRRHRPANAGAHNYCLKDYYAVYSCPYAQQMTVLHSQLSPPRLCEGVARSEEIAAANQHAAHPTNRSDARNDP